MIQKGQYVLTHKWLLDLKQRKTSLQSTTSEKLDNKEDPSMDLNRKERKSKLGSWGSQERVEEESRREEGSRKK